MMRVCPTAAFILCTAVIVSCTNAETPSQQMAPAGASPAPTVPDPRIVYDLREKCGREAREWFKQAWGDGAPKDMPVTADYTAHYNQQLNRCYLLLEVTTSGKTNVMKDKSLLDVSENKGLADLSQSSKFEQPTQCTIGNQSCVSHADWDAFVAPFMNQ